MGVAVDDDVRLIPREKPLRRRMAELVPVADVERQPSGVHHQPRLERRSGGIDVAIDGVNRRDLPQHVEHGTAPDVTGVDDSRDAVERLEQTVANQAVRIGDKADYDGPFAMRLCDVHCHFFSSGFLELLTAAATDLPPSGRATAVSHRLGWDDPGSGEQLADRWVAELDRHGVARAALIASIPGDESAVAAAVARHPSRFVGFFMFNPAGGDVTARLDGFLGDRRLRCICLFPAMHGYSLDDDRVREVFAAADRHGAAVFAHCGVLTVGVRKKLGLPSPFDLRRGDPLALAATAARFPKVPVIVPHFGAGLLRETLMAADQCATIHLDTSSSNGWMKYHPGLSLEAVFRQALAVVGAGRILFGTDSSFFPRGWQRPVHEAQTAAVQAAGVSPPDASQIFGGNFERLFPQEHQP